MGWAMPAPCQNYKTMLLGPVGSLFGSLQAPMMSPQLTIQKRSPELCRMCNDMLELEIVNLEYDDVDEHMENDAFVLLNSCKSVGRGCLTSPHERILICCISCGCD